MLNLVPYTGVRFRVIFYVYYMCLKKIAIYKRATLKVYAFI